MSSQQQTITSSTAPPRLTSFKRYEIVLFDLAAITTATSTLSSDKAMSKFAYDIVRSSAWADFETNRIGLSECQARLSGGKLEAEKIDMVTKLCLEAQFTAPFVRFIQELGAHVKIGLVGNATPPLWTSIRQALEAFSLDILFVVSCEVGCRLPYPAIFEHIKTSVELKSIVLSDVLFLTTSVDAQCTARAQGFSAKLLEHPIDSLQKTRSLLLNPLAPARAWLRQRQGKLNLETTITKATIPDTYCQCLLLELTRDASLIYPSLMEPDKAAKAFSWFCGPCPSGLWDHPADLDCTSLAYLTLPWLTSETGVSSAQGVMDDILKYEVERGSGLLNTWLDDEKMRLDVIALANVVALFYAHGRGDEVEGSKNFLLSVLRTGAYDRGSHYYTNPDFFLFAASRLLVFRLLPLSEDTGHHLVQPNKTSNLQRTPISQIDALRSEVRPLLRSNVLSRTHADADAMGSACRIIAGARCGIKLDGLLNELLELQQEDGSWPAGTLYKFNRLDGTCWHPGLTVALAIRAIEEWASLKADGNVSMA